jgi:hypothetical protein
MTLALPEKIFVSRDKDCTCNLEQRQATVDAAVERKAPWVVDKDGNRLFYVDSFGWRGRIPGECNVCYERLIEKLKESSR